MLNAQSLAFLLSSEEAKQSTKENCDAYKNKLLLQHGGDVEAARQKAREDKQPLAPHPWGAKKTFTTLILLRCFKQAAQDWTPEQNMAYEHLTSLTADEMDLEIASCQSKFQQPLANRVWKFGLILLSTRSTQTRDAFGALLRASSTGVRFEPSRDMQSELEKKLWTRLVQK